MTQNNVNSRQAIGLVGQWFYELDGLRQLSPGPSTRQLGAWFHLAAAVYTMTPNKPIFIIR